MSKEYKPILVIYYPGNISQNSIDHLVRERD